jgi:hypothetical protein
VSNPLRIIDKEFKNLGKFSSALTTPNYVSGTVFSFVFKGF